MVMAFRGRVCAFLVDLSRLADMSRARHFSAISNTEFLYFFDNYPKMTKSFEPFPPHC